MSAWECLVELLVYFNLIKIILIKLFRICCSMDCPLFLYYCCIPCLFIVL